MTQIEWYDDIISRDTSTLFWAKIWKCSKSLCDVIDDVIIAKIVLFDKIWYVENDSAANFKSSFQFHNFSISPPNAVSGDLGNRKGDRIVVTIVT